MKIIAILIILLSVNTCKVSLEESAVKDPQKETTVEMLNNKDTVILTHNEGVFYIMEDGLIKYQLIPIKKDMILIQEVYYGILIFASALLVGVLVLLVIFVEKY